MLIFILLSFIAAFGGFTHGLTGVGVITVALPLMALIVDMKTVIPMVGLLALSINIVLGLQLHKAMDWRLCSPLLIGAVPGIPVGVYVLKTVPSSLLQTVLGGVLMAYGLYAVIQTPVQKNLSLFWAWLAGFLAGGLGGSIGASGPPIIVYTSILPWPKDTIKATMIAFFLCTNLGISTMHTVTGLITLKVLTFYAVSLPGLALGCLLGVMCYGHVQTQTYKWLMSWLILVFGGILAWKGLGL